MNLSIRKKLVLYIWQRNFAQFKRTWLLSFFWVLIEPVFILAALGYGLGSFIPTIKGVSYVEFFFPGLICSSSMLITFFASTYDNFSKLSHQRLFQTQILSPISPNEIVLGEILWAASKGLLSAVGITLVAGLFGLVDTFNILPALLVVFISNLVFSAFGMLITTMVKNFDQIIFPTSGFIIPMSLLSGVYFPIDNLPFGLKYIVYILPLTNTTRVVREFVQGRFDWWMLVNLSYLIVLFIVLIRVSSKRLEEMLLNS